MALLGGNMSNRRAELQYVGFVVFFSVLESVKSGSNNHMHVQPRHTMTYTLLMRFENTTFLLIASIAWRQYVLHVVL